MLEVDTGRSVVFARRVVESLRPLALIYRVSSAADPLPLSSPVITTNDIYVVRCERKDAVVYKGTTNHLLNQLRALVRSLTKFVQVFIKRTRAH